MQVASASIRTNSAAAMEDFTIGSSVHIETRDAGISCDKSAGNLTPSCDLQPDGEMVAGVFGQAVVLDPRLTATRRVDREGEDEIHPLAGKLGGERTGGLGLPRVNHVQRVHVSRLQHLLDDPPRDVPTILVKLLAGARLDLRRVDLLAGRVGIE